MVYKKYIKRNGKVFGPYYYESYRENGKVKTRFVSGPETKKSKKSPRFLFFAISLFLIIAVLLFIFLKFNDLDMVVYTGKVTAYGDPECGDGVIGGAEECDDGDRISGDGCSSNCEKEPLFECGDNVDNDNDRLIDEDDPGCWDDLRNPNTFNPAKNDESVLTTECQDDLDNDQDGLFDELDPGCWYYMGDETTYDYFLNDESLLTVQCQDGLDNDKDSLVDELDPGCWRDATDSGTYYPFDSDEGKEGKQDNYLISKEVDEIAIEKRHNKVVMSKCSEWSVCTVNYNIASIGENELYLEGFQERICSKSVERKKCFLRKPAIIKRAADKLEVYNEEGSLISRIDLKEESEGEVKRLDLEVFV